MFSNYLKSIEGVGIYPLFSLLVFFIFFIFFFQAEDGIRDISV